MREKIAIITTEFLRDFIDESVQKLKLDMDYKIFIYQTFRDVLDVYYTIPDEYHGIVASGSLLATIIQRNVPKCDRVIQFFDNEDADLFGLLLKMLNQNRQMDFSRIYADVFDFMNVEPEEYLFGQKGPMFSIAPSAAIKLTQRISLDEIIQSEEYYKSKHIKLWREGKTDISLTRMSSIMDDLLKEGVNAHFLYPTLYYMRSVFVETIYEVQMNDLRGNQLAAAVVCAAEGKRKSNPEDVNALRTALNKFNKNMKTGMIIQEKSGEFELLTNRKSIKEITQGFTSCMLTQFLGETLYYPAAVGYGIGKDVYQARINAVDANREANLHHRGGACLIDEEDRLVELRERPDKIAIPREASSYAKEVAKRSGLSILSVQKVFSVAQNMEGHQVAAKDLARYLSVTIRSANRFLIALLNAGAAEIVEERKSTTKGRPEKIYKILLEK